MARGHTKPGELCEIVGSGPIPVTVAQRLLEDSFVKAVLVDLPIEQGGPTVLWNLGRLCGRDHEHKHWHDLRPVGEPGRMRFVPAAEWMAPREATPRC